MLLKWAAWRLAIENSWGGPATAAKEDQLWQNITAYFSTGKEPHWDEVHSCRGLMPKASLCMSLLYLYLFCSLQPASTPSPSTI